MKCKFDEAWRGPCEKESDQEYCPEHRKRKCDVCGKQAVKECPTAGSLVCGAPLCADHRCPCSLPMEVKYRRWKVRVLIHRARQEYEKGVPFISDAEYDAYKQELLEYDRRLRK